MAEKTNITLSMVIPTYTFNKDLEDMAERAILSYIDQVDELIVVEDGGMYSSNLQKMADTYIYHKDNWGFTKNINLGWKAAMGEFVALVNSDTYLVRGNIYDLCIPGTVTSPVYKNQDWGGQEGGLAGSFFVVPKEVSQARGILDESLIMWGSDSEYNLRVKDLFERIDTVQIYHEISATIKTTGKDTQEALDRDWKKFEEVAHELYKL